MDQQPEIPVFDVSENSDDSEDVPGTSTASTSSAKTTLTLEKRRTRCHRKIYSSSEDEEEQKICHKGQKANLSTNSSTSDLKVETAGPIAQEEHGDASDSSNSAETDDLSQESAAKDSSGESDEGFDLSVEENAYTRSQKRIGVPRHLRPFIQQESKVDRVSRTDKQ